MNKKTVIVYTSTHHGNTKKLLDAIASHEDVELVNVIGNESYDLSEYERIGIASGVAFGKYYPQMLEFLKNNLPGNKRVFFIHTAGDPRESHADSALKIAESKNCRCLGIFYCKGFDTFGPFKLIGGINKKYPNEENMEQAVKFYRELEANIN